MNIARNLKNVLPEDLLGICSALGELAAPQTLYIVGGAARDTLLGGPPREIDFVLEGDAAALAERAERAGLGRKTATSQFLTVKFLVGQHEIDLATARREEYASSGALPTVAPGDIKNDLARRDFSVNAIAVSVSQESYGSVVDKHGGIADLESRTLRVLHERSFQDDATRMIRAARYAARLDFTLHPETEAWIRRDAAYIRTIGPDRLRHEFDRLWNEPAPEKALDLLATWGVAEHMPTGANWSAALPQAPNDPTVRDATREDIPLLDVYWALLATTAPTESAALIGAFNLSGRPREAVEDVARWMSQGKAAFLLDVTAGRRSRVTAALGGISESALVALQTTESTEIGLIIRDYLADGRHARPALNGNDLLALGVRQGPQIGGYLELLRSAQLDGQANNREDEIALIRKWMREDGTAAAE